jgi:hypothetical protein
MPVARRLHGRDQLPADVAQAFIDTDRPEEIRCGRFMAGKPTSVISRVAMAHFSAFPASHFWIQSN